MATAPWYPPLLANVFVWIGIAFCITQSAIFSGLKLAIFSISKLRLEVEAAGGNRDASAMLTLRKDSNLTLATVLWGNVTINVLLTLLSDAVVQAPAPERLIKSDTLRALVNQLSSERDAAIAESRRLTEQNDQRLRIEMDTLPGEFVRASRGTRWSIFAL
jgi:hypothetical protein